MKKQKKKPYFSDLMKKKNKKAKKENKENKDKKEKSEKKKAGRRPSKPKKTENKIQVIKQIDKRPIRLNAFIAKAGVCSRRQADELIKTGKIKVNGKVTNEMGISVKPTDIVLYKGKQLKPQGSVYILLNKPKNIITTLKDPEGRPTVFDLISHATEERVYPVGRLDRNTTGVLLLTNDGDLTEKLTHPKYRKRKIYDVTLEKPLTDENYEKLLIGIELEEGEKVKADKLEFLDLNDKSKLGIEIHSGQNRVVRRIFEALGYDVKKLDRVYFAGLTKKNVPRGKWRFLTEKEINYLKMNRFN